MLEILKIEFQNSSEIDIKFTGKERWRYWAITVSETEASRDSS